MEKKILVAIGNSGVDQVTIDYLCTLFAGREEINLDLLTVVPVQGVTESQRLLGGDIKAIAMSHPVALKKKKAASRHLDSLKRKLLAAGIENNQISCEALLSVNNVTHTLLAQAKKGIYDAVLLAKRDISALQKMVSSSISTNLWQQDHTIPLWIVSGTPAGRNFLVPVDCTLHTLGAVDHLAFILNGDQKAQITLFHSCSLLGSEHITPRKEFYDKWGKQWCDKHLQGVDDGHFHFHASEQILTENNIPIANIHCVRQKSGIEPAQMITKEMAQKGYSTIVMGRRKETEKNIFKGVSDRVMAHIDNAALWIVG